MTYYTHGLRFSCDETWNWAFQTKVFSHVYFKTRARKMEQIVCCGIVSVLSWLVSLVTGQPRHQTCRGAELRRDIAWNTQPGIIGQLSASLCSVIGWSELCRISDWLLLCSPSCFENTDENRHEMSESEQCSSDVRFGSVLHILIISEYHVPIINRRNGPPFHLLMNVQLVSQSFE